MRNTSILIPSLESCPAFIGESSRMLAVKLYLLKLASTDTTVLITGETGTGKELVARTIHQSTSRRHRPMVCINCAAIPDTLLESELFGYEAGAFTGAVKSTPGKLQQAEDGAIFLDEIGDMSPLAQAKVLRALETREAYRLGGRQGFPIRCRFIAATNQDLHRNVLEGKFRKDLYYRLSVARIDLPPLRDRRDDIPLLLRFFMEEFNLLFDRRIESFSPEIEDLLVQYDWPGNVRELRNLVEALYINLGDDDVRITTGFLPDWFSSVPAPSQGGPEERLKLIAALERTNWNKSKAAHALNWSRMTVYRKIAQYRIRPVE